MPVCSIVKIITQPSIYGVLVYFLLCHESLNYLTIEWHYNMAWLPASLLKHTGPYQHARQRAMFVYSQKRF